LIFLIKKAALCGAAETWYLGVVSDLEKIERAKRVLDENAYKKGLREGFSQGAWMVFAAVVCVYFLIDWFIV
jgi:hypothetical protein